MRDTFHEELDELNAEAIEMAKLVASAVERATRALLDADVSLADSVISADARIDELYRDLDERAIDMLARQQPVATDLRTVITSLRIIADLERMGDLAGHIAKVARMRYPASAVPNELHDSFREMGQVAQQIISKTGAVISTRDTAAARELEADDDRMDLLHRKLFTALLASNWTHGVETAVDITLLGRYYERFADHAVLVARRVVYLVTGEMPPAYVG